MQNTGLRTLASFEINLGRCSFSFRKKKKGPTQPTQHQRQEVAPNKAVRKDMTLVYKKRKKGGQQNATQERVRAKCNCQARMHELVNNCTRCGRIVCAQEGPGECFHCGHVVVPMGKVAPPVVYAKPSAGSAATATDTRVQKGLEQAQKHLDKLLEYEANSVKRTTVYGALRLHCTLQMFLTLVCRWPKWLLWYEHLVVTRRKEISEGERRTTRQRKRGPKE